MSKKNTWPRDQYSGPGGGLYTGPGGGMYTGPGGGAYTGPGGGMYTGPGGGMYTGPGGGLYTGPGGGFTQAQVVEPIPVQVGDYTQAPEVVYIAVQAVECILVSVTNLIAATYHLGLYLFNILKGMICKT